MPDYTPRRVKKQSAGRPTIIPVKQFAQIERNRKSAFTLNPKISQKKGRIPAPKKECDLDYHCRRRGRERLCGGGRVSEYRYGNNYAAVGGKKRHNESFRIEFFSEFSRPERQKQFRLAQQRRDRNAYRDRPVRLVPTDRRDPSLV